MVLYEAVIEAIEWLQLIGNCFHDFELKSVLKKCKRVF